MAKTIREKAIESYNDKYVKDPALHKLQRDWCYREIWSLTKRRNDLEGLPEDTPIYIPKTLEGRQQHLRLLRAGWYHAYGAYPKLVSREYPGNPPQYESQVDRDNLTKEDN